MAKREWYKEMAVYQIWPRSFCDGNGDGIGDLWGVLQKLDYIKSLNVDAIWFAPLYPSPNADFGCDVTDYTDIHPDFGDLELFKKVLEEAHKRGLRVFMDLPMNHTSDRHPWFRASRRERHSPYRNYYHWRPGRQSGKRLLPPNNWSGIFEGEAWEYDSNTDEFYLHLFSAKQPDLNLSEPRVRQELKEVMRFWLDLGVDGFREDVISFLGKTPGLPSVFPPLPGLSGLRHFSDRPEVISYLTEFRRDVLDYYDCFTVGDCPLASPETALRYINEGENKLLDEIMSAEHLDSGFPRADLLPRPFELKRMKRSLSRWQTELEGRGWNALYLESHDHPRSISRFGSESYRTESGKMLAAMYILQRGTPFIYQGQEIGMLNHRLPGIDMYKDVQTHEMLRRLSRRLGGKKAFALVQERSRENARTPMQWTGSKNAGFSAGTPWFAVNPNYHEINVQREEADPDSLLNFYRKLLKFRRDNPIVLYGSYEELMHESSQLYVYQRRWKGQRLLVVCSFTNELVRFEMPLSCQLSEGRLVLSNYEHNFVIGNGFTTRPYELRVYMF